MGIRKVCYPMNNMVINFPFPGPVIYGQGAIECLGEQVEKMGGKHPLLVTGKKIEKLGLLDAVTDSIKKVGIDLSIFQDSGINPTVMDVERGVRRYIDDNCDMLIALGGGSRIDIAKAIRLMVSHSGDINSYFFDSGGFGRINPVLLPVLICIPTTAGSGSEVSRGAVITDKIQKRKRLIAGPGMTSSLSIIDPDLTLTMDKQTTAMTGMDALSHALETSVGKNYNPFADGLSLHAATVIYKNLPKVMENGRDVDARMNMLIASGMAAIGFAKGLGVVHSLAHQILNVSHGIAISILLPYGMEFNLDVCYKEYSSIATTIGLVSPGSNPKKNAELLVDAIRGLCIDFNLPTRLSEIGIKREELEIMSENALLDHCHKTNPKSCDKDDMFNILSKAF